MSTYTYNKMSEIPAPFWLYYMDEANGGVSKAIRMKHSEEIQQGWREAKPFYKEVHRLLRSQMNATGHCQYRFQGKRNFFKNLQKDVNNHSEEPINNVVNEPGKRNLSFNHQPSKPILLPPSYFRKTILLPPSHFTNPTPHHLFHTNTNNRNNR